MFGTPGDSDCAVVQFGADWSPVGAIGIAGGKMQNCSAVGGTPDGNWVAIGRAYGPGLPTTPDAIRPDWRGPVGEDWSDVFVVLAKP